MKQSVVFGLMASVIVVASVGVAQAQGKDNKNVIYMAAEKATFSQSPTAGVSMAVLWGDPNKGPHGTFTKFAPGYDAGMHTHTSDVCSKALISIRMMRAKSVWGRESSSESRVATNIGAVATKRKARCFIRKGLGNSISYQRSRSGHS
jgi:hypothetical protein